MTKVILFFCLVASSFSGVYAQPTKDKSQMEKERQEIQQEIREIQGMYDKVKGQKKETLGQLTLLQRKISLQDKYINNISKEVKMLNDNIFLSNVEIYRLQKQLDTLKMQYSRSVVYAYKNRSTYDYLNFIFSASNFNDALKRIGYLKSYRAYREQQVNNILETQKLILQRKKDNLARMQQKSSTLQVQTKEVKILEDQKKEKDAVVSKLKSKENELAKQMADKKKRDKQLQSAIAAVVRREIDNARKMAEENAKKSAAKNETPVINPAMPNTTTKKVSTAPKNYLDLNDKDVALNTSFEKNRGKLPWPVDNGFVSIHFGPGKVENTLLTMDNPGITISTPSAGAVVKAVFDGEVAGISNIGDGMIVVIRHGKYFTTYSNLTSASVSRGAVVKTGQAIGRAGEGEDGTGGQIDFLLMILDKKVNPEPWLRR